MHRRFITLAAAAAITTGLSAQNKICTVYGAANFDEFGRGVSGAGDVDKDGVPDFVVGGHEIGRIGYAKVYSGADGRELHTFKGLDRDDTFGRAVGAAGDVNKDGYADVIVGAPEDCG